MAFNRPGGADRHMTKEEIDSPILYKLDVVWGSVQMGRPTGEWIQHEDGWWSEVYTDTIHYDGYGVEVWREPTPTFVRMSQPPPWYPHPKQSLWQRFKTAFFF